jgi:hypothetical protein
MNRVAIFLLQCCVDKGYGRLIGQVKRFFLFGSLCRFKLHRQYDFPLRMSGFDLFVCLGGIFERELSAEMDF